MTLTQKQVTQLERLIAQVQKAGLVDWEANFDGRKKSLKKDIPVGNNGAFMRIALYYTETRTPKVYKPIFSIRIWTPNRGSYMSIGLGVSCYASPETVTKRDFKKLCQIAAQYSNADFFISEYKTRQPYSDLGGLFGKSLSLDEV